MIDYTTILQKGKDNAISTDTLCSMLNFKDSRALQADIARARKDGQVILSCSTGGYFLPEDAAEVQRFVSTLSARAINTLGVLKSAKSYLRQIDGQQDLDL